MTQTLHRLPLSLVYTALNLGQIFAETQGPLRAVAFWPELQAIHKRNPCFNCKGPVVAACQREEFNVSVVSAFDTRAELHDLCTSRIAGYGCSADGDDMYGKELASPIVDEAALDRAAAEGGGGGNLEAVIYGDPEPPKRFISNMD